MTAEREDLTDRLERWVPAEQTHPAMNVWGRRWVTADGTMRGVYYPGQDLREAHRRGLLWGNMEPPPADLSAGRDDLVIDAEPPKRAWWRKLLGLK